MLNAPLTCAFIDNLKEVRSDEPADPWKGVTVVTKIKEQFAPNYLIHTSKVLPATNSYTGMVASEPVKLSSVNCKRFITTIDLTGKDPEGNLQKKIFQNSDDVGDVKNYTIFNINIMDPAPKTSVHKSTNTIVMLYGRMDQQEIFKDADYKGGDFEKNPFENGKVHLLLPMTGEVSFEYKVEPKGLLYTKEEAFTRSTVTYDYKQQVFTYREDIKSDEDLYKKLKDKFTIEKYSPSLMSKMNFDISIEEKDRSKYDCHCDVIGVQNGDPKTIMLTGRFTYVVKNQLDVEVGEQIQIQSITSDDLKSLKREYYKHVPGSNVIYIPPITIYWGGGLGKM